MGHMSPDMEVRGFYLSLCCRFHCVILGRSLSYLVLQFPHHKKVTLKLAQVERIIVTLLVT